MENMLDVKKRFKYSFLYFSVTWIQKHQGCRISTLSATQGASNGSALMELYVLN